MALLSEGGLTSPDIWIAIMINIVALISILLNPLVFRHNFRKKRSIARDLYMSLSATEFLSGLFLPITITIGILRPKEEQCYQDHDIHFCQNDYYKYNRTATIPEKVTGTVMWYFIYSPLIHNIGSVHLEMVSNHISSENPQQDRGCDICCCFVFVLCD